MFGWEGFMMGFEIHLYLDLQFIQFASDTPQIGHTQFAQDPTMHQLQIDIKTSPRYYTFKHTNQLLTLEGHKTHKFFFTKIHI